MTGGQPRLAAGAYAEVGRITRLLIVQAIVRSTLVSAPRFAHDG